MRNFEKLEDVVKAGIKLTPMMKQYFEIKGQQPDSILFFRMGDFYEVFFEDAKITSKLLNIALTHRGKLGDVPIPMAGIPHHAANTYIDRLTGQGVKVAICEQMEDPKEAKGIVKRAITQIVSPGLPYDLDKAKSEINHYIVATFFHQEQFSATYLDFTTGEFKGAIFNHRTDFLEFLIKLNAKEFILYPQQWQDIPEINNFFQKTNSLTTLISKDYFEADFTTTYIKRLIPNFNNDKIIQKNASILSTVGAISYYIDSTQLESSFTHIWPFQLINRSNIMNITIKTLNGLEILPTSNSSYKESLLGFFDRTCSAFGPRKLKDFFLQPLTDLSEIKQRQRLINFFLKHSTFHEQVRGALEDVRDIERILTKISTRKASGADLLNLAKAYQAYSQLLQENHSVINTLDPIPKTGHKQLTTLTTTILQTINDEIGASIEKGNLIKPGADPQRDKLAILATSGSDAIKELEVKYKEETGINNLRIKSNNVAGFFIEVSKSHINKVPEEFKRRQTLVNCERYLTQELTTLERSIYSSRFELEAYEREIFISLVEQVKEQQSHFLKLSQAISFLDIMQSLAYVTKLQNFSCPTFVKECNYLQYKNGWHPLIKASLDIAFIPHSLDLNPQQYFALITGPNMSGKTTVMRSAAIIQYLAQLGCFVPCEEVKLSVCDYIFSRLGASDNIQKGQSTFMVEMTETSEIIRHATRNSLIVLDEIGRGTSTFDGISLAWSLVEYFVKKTKAITLFATHYHELIELTDELPQAKNLTVETQVEENKDGSMHVQFMYNLIEQAANQSYGIYVAKLAGLPSTILKRSRTILKQLERLHKKNQLPSHQQQLGIFEVPTTTSKFSEKAEAIFKRLEQLDINNLTPIQALQQLAELKSLYTKKN